MFKRGGYRGQCVANYLSTAADQHLCHGYERSPLLARYAALVKTSCRRGEGPSQQSLPIPLEGLMAWQGSGAAPHFGRYAVLATFFMLREIDMAAARVKHLEFP